MAELSSISNASVFNQVYPIQKPDYSREVTEASQKAWVFVLLTAADSNVESRVAEELWRELAREFGDIKFCKMRGNLCIEGYPDKNCPTVLIYKDGDIKRQIVTLRELNGPRTSVERKAHCSSLTACTRLTMRRFQKAPAGPWRAATLRSPLEAQRRGRRA